jgi:hypothetical protein
MSFSVRGGHLMVAAAARADAAVIDVEPLAARDVQRRRLAAVAVQGHRFVGPALTDGDGGGRPRVVIWRVARAVRRRSTIASATSCSVRNVRGRRSASVSSAGSMSLVRASRS